MCLWFGLLLTVIVSNFLLAAKNFLRGVLVFCNWVFGFGTATLGVWVGNLVLGIGTALAGNWIGKGSGVCTEFSK